MLVQNRHPVSHDYEVPFAFTGKIDKVVVDLKGQRSINAPHGHIRNLDDLAVLVAVGTQSLSAPRTDPY